MSGRKVVHNEGSSMPDMSKRKLRGGFLGQMSALRGSCVHEPLQ